MGISGAQPVNTGAATGSTSKSAVKTATAASTSSSTASSTSTSSSTSSTDSGKPRSMEILELIMDPANAQKMSYGYDTPQEIADWYKRKNQESQAAWAGYQGKQQTAAMLGQAISAGAGMLGQLMAGAAKGRGGPGGDQAASAAAGKAGGCANGKCGGAPQAPPQTQGGGCADGKCNLTWQENTNARTPDQQFASTNTTSSTLIAQAYAPTTGTGTILDPADLNKTDSSTLNIGRTNDPTEVVQLDTPNFELPPEPIQQPEPPPPPEVIV